MEDKPTVYLSMEKTEESNREAEHRRLYQWSQELLLLRRQQLQKPPKAAVMCTVVPFSF